MDAAALKREAQRAGARFVDAQALGPRVDDQVFASHLGRVWNRTVSGPKQKPLDAVVIERGIDQTERLDATSAFLRERRTEGREIGGEN